MNSHGNSRAWTVPGGRRRPLAAAHVVLVLILALLLVACGAESPNQVGMPDEPPTDQPGPVEPGAGEGEGDGPGVVEPSADVTDQKLTAEPRTQFEWFGTSVDVGQEHLIAGAPGNDTDAFQGGAAYVFSLADGTYGPAVRLSPPEPRDSSIFGYAVALSGDDAFVAAPFDDRNGERAGAVFHYRHGPEGWQYAGEISNGQEYSYFGSSIDVDGELLVVGAPGPSALAAYIYREVDGEWRLDGELTSSVDALAARPDGAVTRNFGGSVAVSGSTVAVGAWAEVSTSDDEVDETAVEASYVAVYEPLDGGWAQQQTLESDEPFDRFGWSLSLAGDRLAVGAPGSDAGGSVHLFERGPTGWTLATVTDFPGERDGGFGWDVALEGDLLAVGAPRASGREDAPAAGAAYVFDLARDAGPLGCFSGAPISDQDYGSSLALHANRLVVGAIGDLDDTLPAGAAYVHGLPLADTGMWPSCGE